MDPNAITGTGSPHDRSRAWVDPLLALLAILALALAGLSLRARARPAPLERAGLQGRLAELPFAAERLARGLRLPVQPPDPERQARAFAEPWDRALLGVLAAERGDLELGRRLARDPHLPGPSAKAFRRCWDRAFEGGPAADPADLAQARRALGEGWVAGILEARLATADGQDGEPALARALERVKGRLAVAAALGLGGLAALLASLVLGLLLLVRRRTPRVPVPDLPCSGRALALVGLGWFLGLQLSGALLVPLLVRVAPLRPYALPLAYGLHAGWGILLLRWAFGGGWAGYGRRLWSAGWRTVGWGLAHLAFAVPLVFAASWLAAPLTRRFPPPQRELVELLGGLPGGLPLLATALTVAVIAPCFEELLFRGALLPVLARRWGWVAGIAGSGLLFGAIHLQPAGLPTLGVLGMLLGAAFRRGGLGASILVHATWNGAVFLFLRAMVA